MRQLHDAPAVMRHGTQPSGSFGLGSASMDPSFPMNPVKCEPVETSPYRYGQGGLSPMYPGIPSPVPRMADYPMKSQQPSPSGLAPVSPMGGMPSPGQRASPMGAPFPPGVVAIGDQGIYGMQQPPNRRDAPQACLGAATNPFSGQQRQAGGSTMLMDGPAMGVEHQNFSLELNLDSGDLAGMEMRLSESSMALFDANLSENLSSHLTLSDAEGGQRSSVMQACGLLQQMPVYGQQELLQHREGQCGLQTKERVQTERTEGDGAVGGPVQQNMTDSFTSQIKTTIEDICTLNDMYKGTSNGGVE